jgi:diaminopimelate decarboxylase
MLPALWPATAQRSTNGALRIGGVDVRSLAAEFGTPAYLLDAADFRARAAEFRTAFADFDVYYAGKAFLCTEVARWVHALGLGLDVCSGGELAVALRAGFDPARIVFHGNNKSSAELSRALDVGVGRIVVDSFDEIDRIEALAARCDRRVSVLARVTTGVDAGTHHFIATALEDQKFGFSLASGAAISAVRALLASSRLRLAGLHSHVGSQVFDAAGFDVAIRRLLTLCARVRDELDVELPELNVGGGFGVAYTTRDHPQPPAVLAAGIRGAVQRGCAALGLAVPAMAIEPGRAIAGPSTVTVYEVGTVKHVSLGGTSRRYVSVDGGMSDNIRAALYGADLSCTLASRRSTAPAALTRVVGKHCEAGDILVRDEFLPTDVRSGDLLAIPGTGAYGRSMASNYNHMPRPPVVAVENGTAWLVVRRETEDDLLRLDVP